jgi:hypothetical protein
VHSCGDGAGSRGALQKPYSRCLTLRAHGATAVWQALLAIPLVGLYMGGALAVRALEAGRGQPQQQG